MGTSGLSASLRLAGGPAAPRAARLAVLSELEGRIDAGLAGDIEVIVSELVTNSVRHAGVGPEQTVVVDVLLLRDRLRIVVVDPGAERVPHIADREPGEPGGLGLLLVERLSASWGVARDGAGATRVWCELTVGPRGEQRKPS